MRDDEIKGRFRHEATRQPTRNHHVVHQPIVQTTAQSGIETIAKKSKRSRDLQQKILIGIAALAILSTAAMGFFYYKKVHASNQSYFPANISKAQISIPVYYPVSLPAGYAVGSFSVIKKNILSYDVTDPSGNEYFVTMQALPISFDFTGFAKKFAQPDQYGTPIGNVLVGVAGSQLIGSVQTNQNVWIILNAKNSSPINNMETITRAFRQVNL